MNCRMPGLPVLHCLPEVAQTHVHWFDDPSNHLILYCPFLLPPSIFPSIRVFSKESALTSGDQSTGASASASVLPINIQGWFPWGFLEDWFDLLAWDLLAWESKGLSRVSSSTTVSAFFMVQLSHPYMTTGKNHSFDYMDLCQQSDVSAF